MAQGISPHTDRLRRVASRQNARIKQLRSSFHEAAPNDQGEIAVEGMHLVEEAVRAGLRISTVFFSELAVERAHKLLPQLSAQTEALLLPKDVFSGAVPTQTTQGVAAFVRLKPFTKDAVFTPEPPLVILAAGLQDPGNLGTIVRSAEAFGATGVILGERTVSPWNWKAVRASAGSIFRLPASNMETAEAMSECASRRVRLLATSSHKGIPIMEADLGGPVALMIGSEGAGLGKELLSRADEVVAIPHSSRVESLNAAIAASIVLYEAARQRGFSRHEL